VNIGKDFSGGGTKPFDVDDVFACIGIARPQFVIAVFIKIIDVGHLHNDI
jgi:hypothetical protein